MATVQFRNELRKINITKVMRTPKKITALTQWLKEARKAISEIPDEYDVEGWFVMSQDVSINFIRFDLQNRIGEKAYIVIDRKARRFGK